MAAKGFASHVARNRRRALGFVGLYCLTFVPIALLLLGIVPVLLGDAMHSIFVDPLHYGPTYLPLAISLALVVLARSYFGFRRKVADALEIREVTERDEPRLVRIGEEQATLQGLANPKFGVIETGARNAISIGATPGQRCIAVTRGLLDSMDDEEVAAIIAHELAHFRAGDAAFLTLNHALISTALLLQTYNPIKLEKNVHQKIQWHMVIAIFIPIMLLVQAIGGMMTWYAARLARRADASVRSARDFVADAEALRITHFPEALQTAISKCDNRGYFPGAERYEAMLFSGNPTSSGGSHPSARERFAEIASIAHELYSPGRRRRDSRTDVPRTPFVAATRQAFGKRGVEPALAIAGHGSFAEAERRAREIPREPGLWLLYASVFDRKAYREWQNAMFDQMKWRVDDQRNFFGATTEMTFWFAGCLLASVWFYSSISTSQEDFLDRFSGRIFFEGSDKAAESLYCAPGDTECREKGVFRSNSRPVAPTTISN